jgi:hypothetical protein
VNHRTAQLSFLVLLALVGACGTTAKSPTKPLDAGKPAAGLQAPAGTIYTQEATSAGLSIHAVRAADGADLGNVPHGVTSADGRRSYVIRATSTSRTLTGSDNVTGRVDLSVPVPDGFNLADEYLDGGGPGPLSPNGRWLVLFHDQPVSAAQPRARFMVVDTTAATPPRAIDLAGHFEFDAVDSQGTTLYLVERPTDSADYRVRAYDLGAGALKPGIIAEKGPIQEAMSGYRVASVSPGEGSWLFSLYLKPSGSAFVHALSLKDQYAVCIDLPVPDAQGEPNLSWSLAAHDAKVYAINSARGQAVTIDIADLKVTAHASFKAPGPTALQNLWGRFAPVVNASAKNVVMGNAQVTADGESVLAPGPHGVVELSTRTLALRRVLLQGDAVSGVRLVGTATLLAVVPEKKSIEVIDLATGMATRSLALVDPPTGIAAVAP